MNHDRYIIGIDGGGTKTRLALADSTGRVLARALAGHSNVHNVEMALAVANIRHAVRHLVHVARLSGTPDVLVVAGLAGLDSPLDFTVGRDLLWRACHGVVSSQDKIHLVNDAIIGFYTGSPARVGICVIGGTGSNCYGRNKKGEEAWAGGLGHILADEGSGYDIGLRALHAAVKSFDGRGPKTLLEKLVLAHFGAHNPRSLVPKVYYTRFGKHEIAQLALVVEEAARKKDKVALEITAIAAYELLSSVRAVAKRLGFVKSSVFDVVMIGGVLQKDPFVTAHFRQGLKKYFPRALPVIPAVEPVMGAIQLGVELVLSDIRQ